MISDANRASIPLPLRPVLCLLLFVAACLAASGGISSSHVSGQGGSASPKDDGKSIAEGANFRRQSRTFSRRVGESPRRPFHQKIAPWVIEHLANGQQIEFFVVLADQADLTGAAALRTKAEKGRYVHDALWNKSQTTQGSILQWLHERGIEHRSFYIVNAILV